MEFQDLKSSVLEVFGAMDWPNPSSVLVYFTYLFMYIYRNIL